MRLVAIMTKQEFDALPTYSYTTPNFMLGRAYKRQHPNGTWQYVRVENNGTNVHAMIIMLEEDNE